MLFRFRASLAASTIACMYGIEISYFRNETVTTFSRRPRCLVYNVKLSIAGSAVLARAHATASSIPDNFRRRPHRLLRTGERTPTGLRPGLDQPHRASLGGRAG